MKHLQRFEQALLRAWIKKCNAKNPHCQRQLWRLMGRTNTVYPSGHVAFWMDVTRGRNTE